MSELIFCVFHKLVYIYAMFQNALLKTIQEHLPARTSLNEAIAEALDISYDAAHRRTSLKSKLSIDETLILAKQYDISIDKLFGTTHQDYIAVEKTTEIKSEAQLESYYLGSIQSLRPLLKQPESHILYSAKDIPLFYTLGDDILSRFKSYVWLKLLDPNFDTRSFEGFSPSVGALTAAKELSSLYKHLKITEIWDITTVNSTLKQIHFYQSSGHLSLDSALSLCHALTTLIESIEEKVNTNNGTYKLYYNELLLMNNNVLVSTPQQQSLYVPFTLLSYYLTSDQSTCAQAESYLQQQLHHSKLLNASGEKEKRFFFNKIFAKIDALKQLIEATELLDFE